MSVQTVIIDKKNNTSTSKKTKHAFGELLKKWRKQKRLSQLDFSLEVGVSQRHLSFLESGRSRPSREMVLQLSRALELPKREANQLLMSAGFAAVYEQRDLSNVEMTAVNEVLKMMLAHHQPFPALVVDRNWNLLIANEAAEFLVSALGEKEAVWKSVDPSGDKNVYRMTFSMKGLRPLISNWELVKKSLILRLRREMNADPENEYLAQVYAEIHQEIVGEGGSQPKFLLDDVLEGAAPVLPLELSIGGMTLKVFSVISSFGSALDVTAEEIRIETFFPADELTRQFFHRISSH